MFSAVPIVMLMYSPYIQANKQWSHITNISAIMLTATSTVYFIQNSTFLHKNKENVTNLEKLGMHASVID